MKIVTMVALAGALLLTVPGRSFNSVQKDSRGSKAQASEGRITPSSAGGRAARAQLEATIAAGQAPQALFYMMRSANSKRSFEEHAAQINVIVPTWYSVERNGRLIGQPDPAVLRIAKEHQVQVMPIVSAWDFHPITYHAFLNDRLARRRFAQTLVEACRRYGYAGFQIDFEDINFIDRAALSSTVAEVARALHGAGYELSIATVPNAPGLGPPTAFDQWLYHHWGGVYDLRALAKSVDWICLMTYDEHTRFTPPGPVAGYQWVVQQLDYALEQVPKQKLSLGIPLYGYRWWAGKPRRRRVGNRRRYEPNVEANSLSAPAALRLAMEFHRLIQWDAPDETAWFDFYRGGRREWVFFTNGRAFAQRLNLARELRLKGFCAWVLGDEDPTIWKYLPAGRSRAQPRQPSRVPSVRRPQ